MKKEGKRANIFVPQLVPQAVSTAAARAQTQKDISRVELQTDFVPIRLQVLGFHSPRDKICMGTQKERGVLFGFCFRPLHVILLYRRPDADMYMSRFPRLFFSR